MLLSPQSGAPRISVNVWKLQKSETIKKCSKFQKIQKYSKFQKIQRLLKFQRFQKAFWNPRRVATSISDACILTITQCHTNSALYSNNIIDANGVVWCQGFEAAFGEGDALLPDIEELPVLLPLLRMLRVRHPQKAGALNLDRLSCHPREVGCWWSWKGRHPQPLKYSGMNDAA